MPMSMSRLSRIAALTGLALLGSLPASAQEAKPTLTVYTYSSFAGKYGPAKTIKERFEAVCACTLDFVATDDAAALLARLKLEGASSRADAVVGLDNNLLAEAKETGLFAKRTKPSAGTAVPGGWSDDTFVPVDFGWFAFVYDETKLKTPPASLKDLVENPSGPRIVIQDPRTSSVGLGLMLWMQKVYGDEAPAAWAKLKPRIVTVTKGWSEAYGLFLKGEADMALSYQSSPAYHVGAEKKQNFKAAMFPEGHYLQVEVAGALKSARNPALAERFVDFVLDDAFQSALPETNWMYPAHQPATGLPASFAGLVQPKISLEFKPQEVQANRRAWTDAWLAAMSR